MRVTIYPINVPDPASSTPFVDAVTSIPLYVGGVIGSVVTWFSRQSNIIRYVLVGISAMLFSMQCWSRSGSGHETVVVNPNPALDV